MRKSSGSDGSDGSDGSYPWVAVKVLKRQQFTKDGDFEVAVQLEANVLEVMKSLEHAHLIQTIACYRRGGANCLVFPWADCGNLNDYWEESKLTTEDRLKPEHLDWVFNQLRGLAEAINLLHGKIIRHGDLKPENILCFGERQSAEDPKTSCMLVIADAGLSKVNYQITQLRERGTIGPKGGTLMYEPPEAEIESDKPTSRRYDVWSMGCVCLEFLIWLVDGITGLRKFREELRRHSAGKFYEPQLSKIRLVKGTGRRPEVDSWIEKLRQHQCSQGEGNPLGRLVEIIDTKLLVHDLGNDDQQPLASPSRLGAGNSGAANAPAGYRAITPSRGRQETGDMSTTTSEPPAGSRVKSDTMFDEFNRILRADTKSFGLPATALGRLTTQHTGSGQRLRPQSATGGTASIQVPVIGNPGVRNKHSL